MSAARAAQFAKLFDHSVVRADAEHTPTLVHVLVLGVAGFAIRAWLIWRYPAVFGGDTVLRLANWEHVLLSYQLPLPQALVYVLHPFEAGPLLIRCAMAVVGALAGISFYLFATTVVPAAVAFTGALFFVTNPMILPLSTVPYQEIVLLAGVVAAFYGALVDRWYLAAASLAIACLARYEGWLACPWVALLYVQRKGWSLRHVGEAALLFGWVPVVWIAYNRGITPPGSFAVESRISLERFARWVHVGSVTLRQTAIPVLILAVFGTLQIWRRSLWRGAPYWVFTAYLVSFLIALLFSAHGTSPDPERYVTSREAHVPLVGMALLATVGLCFLPRYRWSVATLCAVTGFWMSDRLMRRETNQPRLALSVAVANYLDAHVRADERAVVLCAPITTIGIGGYLDHLERDRGPAGRAAGISNLNFLDTRPPDYQRILVHSRFGKAQLGNYSSLIAKTRFGSDTVVRRPVPDAPPDWIVAWSDFRPTSVGEERIAAMVAARSPVATFRSDSLSLAVYHVR